MHNSKREFSVKSAYKLEWESKLQVKSEARLEGYHNLVLLKRFQQLWKKIWKIDVPPKVMPPKVRVFIWRIIRNILPTKDKLSTTRVLIDGLCYLCSHICFQCPYTCDALPSFAVL